MGIKLSNFFKTKNLFLTIVGAGMCKFKGLTSQRVLFLYHPMKEEGSEKNTFARDHEGAEVNFIINPFLK